MSGCYVVSLERGEKIDSKTVLFAPYTSMFYFSRWGYTVFWRCEESHRNSSIHFLYLILHRLTWNLEPIPRKSGHKAGTLWMGYEALAGHNHIHGQFYFLQSTWRKPPKQGENTQTPRTHHHFLLAWLNRISADVLTMTGVNTLRALKYNSRVVELA